MKQLVLAVTCAVLAACGGPDEPGAGAEPPSDTVVHPGDVAIDLNALLGLPPGSPPVSWRFQAGSSTFDATLTPAGIFRGVSCAGNSANVWPARVTVEAVNPGGQVIRVLHVDTDEALLRQAPLCVMVSGETLCRDPADGASFVIPVGATLTIHSGVVASCHSFWQDPPGAPPAGACPHVLPDPAFQFCDLAFL